MPMLPTAFNQADHDDMSSGFDVYPVDWYNMQVDEAEMKLTKAAEEAKEAGDPNFEAIGQRLVMKMRIMDGEFADKFFYNGLNLVNKNPKAVEISQKEFATFLRAAGVTEAVEETEQLVGLCVRVHLGQRGKETDAYGIQNTVKGYEPYDGNVPAVSKPAGGAVASGKKSGRSW